jgi:hypothetical protein
LECIDQICGTFEKIHGKPDVSLVSQAKGSFSKYPTRQAADKDKQVSCEEKE